ncbi:hypothetical protein [Flavobacterium sp.]|uniref:hypothetical protein n=1 Tax=Flavobacterium sp. TaxID=239 RepID=UPI002622AE53|nr:hypothetical protein [Flavobacterium sp.]
MKKSILNLQGVLELSKNEQKTIIGSRSNRICCERCADGSCNGWTTAGVPCPIALPCPN